MAHWPSVVLHTSWRGRATTAFAPIALLALGGYGLLDRFRWFPFVLVLVGLLLAWVAVADYPIVTVLGADGVERRCLLRRQHLGWERISTLARPSQVSRWRRDHHAAGAVGGAPSARATGLAPAHSNPRLLTGAKGGLVAEVRRRPFLLCDKIESRAEFDHIVDSMTVWAPALPVRASRPDASVPPTWLHKKRRGRASDGLVDLLA
ncbi:MAG: hypothetical protein R2733_21875 [Acidimicrobiales bacterium]